ncbi:mitochondrial inner membrane protease subunit 1-like isoform X2 [Glandiceps talaboti]
MPVLKKFVWKTLGLVSYMVQYGCIAHCTLEHLADFVFCYGPSMEPTIFSNDVVFTEHVSIKMKTIKKGDIVITKSPTNPREYVCKRVIAMEGEEVCANPSSVFRNYELVPKGHVWLEGDNTANSTDSRMYGPVPFALLRGKAFLKAWPLDKVGSLRSCPNEIKGKTR